jgi:hypothetical protein
MRLRLSMTNVKHNDRVALNCEEDAIPMRLAPLKQLPYFEREFRTFRRQRATFGKLGKGCDGFPHPLEPAQAGLPGEEPF